MSLIGIDVNSFDDMDNLYQKYGINFFQISAKNVDRFITKYHKDFDEILKPNYSIVVHYSYSINLANTWSPSDWWIQLLISEIRQANYIKAFAIVIHTGKSLALPENVAINNMFSSLLYVHEQTRDTDIKILIETPAGQGTEILYDIDKFIKFMKKFDLVLDRSGSPRFGVCIDTCHVFAAGYDISQIKTIDEFFSQFHKNLGVEKIKLVHFNNSRGELGSKIDRHENLEEGTLDMTSIKTIASFINKLGIPMCLETNPGQNYKLILKDYNILKNIV